MVTQTASRAALRLVDPATSLVALACLLGRAACPRVLSSNATSPHRKPARPLSLRLDPDGLPAFEVRLAQRRPRWRPVAGATGGGDAAA